MQSNSTEALLQLWHMCVKSQGALESVLQWETLRKVMAGLPMARQEAMRSGVDSGVDQILQRHFGAARHEQHDVNFTLFWRGMEAILQSAGVFNNTGFEDEILQVIASLRHFRDLLPQLGPRGSGARVGQLRQLYGRLQQAAQTEVVAEYWASKLLDLPEENDTVVSADEIAFALLKWLEELLGCDASEEELDDEPEQEQQPEVARLRHLTMPEEASFAGWSWLGHSVDPEVVSFRQRMVRALPSNDPDHVLLHFYRAVRDALDVADTPQGSPSRARLRVTRASLRSGVALLERVALREVRGAFRQMQRSTRRLPSTSNSTLSSARPSTPRSEACGIVAGLVCSQALAAQVLDRRANLAPRAFYMAWLLERARRQCLLSVLSTWRAKQQSTWRESRSAAQGSSPTRRVGRAQSSETTGSSPRRVLRSKTPTKTAIV
ncbi:unnamed protein product [Durusdinium trenchii]|uniref:Uncharacterized protein n=1 Tax=Durusdinium trenchii TaxID=1381693 RepID=A0ABP0QY58_9DINO